MGGRGDIGGYNTHYYTNDSRRQCPNINGDGHKI
jgi:hypothetical protein